MKPVLGGFETRLKFIKIGARLFKDELCMFPFRFTEILYVYFNKMSLHFFFLDLVPDFPYKVRTFCSKKLDLDIQFGNF